jgi:VWFA-related protein
VRWLLLAIAPLALSQEPIRVSTRLIETDVVVRDSHGPVANLTQDSFKLLEDRKPQRIAVFRVSKASTETPKPLPPGVFSNRAASSRQPRYKAIVIDALNTSFPHQVYVRTQIMKMLDQMEIRDPLALYVMGEKFRVLQDFTTDKAKLKAGIQAFRPENSHFAQMAMPTLIDGAIISAKEKPTESVPMFADEQRRAMTLSMLKQLGEHLASAPGRKSIIWITDFQEGIPKGLGTLPDETERWRGLGPVAIYAVYAGGMGLRIADDIAWVSEQNGGRAYYNRNDIDGAVREAINDDAVTYTLGFYAQREKPDDNYHSLKVEVDRRGTEVRSRAGYIDRNPKLSEDAGPESATPLHRIAIADFDATDIGLIASAEHRGSNLHVAVRVDINDLKLDRENDHWKGSATLAVVEQAVDGSTFKVSSKALNFDMTDKVYQARRRDGFAMETSVPARSGIARIKVTMVDQTGAAGSVSVVPR